MMTGINITNSIFPKKITEIKKIKYFSQSSKFSYALL